MNKYEYLANLRNCLTTLPQDERDAAMSYYEEFFSDAGEDNEQAVIESLGAPDLLARKIIDDNRKEAPETENTAFVPPPTPQQTARKWTGGQIALLVVLLVLSSPIWLGLFLGLFGGLIGLIAGIFGTIVGVAVAGVGSIICGFAALFTGNVAFGLLNLGIGLICVGLVPLAFYPLCKLVVKLIVICAKGVGSLINKISGKGGVQA